MWTKIIINKQMMIMHVVLQKQICIIFRLSHNSKTNLCSSIYHIAVLIVLQRQPPNNHLYRKRLPKPSPPARLQCCLRTHLWIQLAKHSVLAARSRLSNVNSLLLSVLDQRVV